MTKVVYEFSAPLVAISPVHVGSGHFGERDAVGGKEGANTRPEVALLARDAKNRPYLPATSLKGVLRRLAGAADSASEIDVDSLFGSTSSGRDGRARMGVVHLRGASLVRGGDVADAPYVARDAKSEFGPGVFVAARTAIDRDLGIASDGLLYFQEMVAPGSVFGFRALVERTGPNAAQEADAAAKAFAGLLKKAADEVGFSIGKGQADGSGRMRIDGTRMVVKRYALDVRGDFVAADASSVWRDAHPFQVRTDAQPVRKVRFGLSCRGPFIVVDASKRAKRGERTEGDKTPQVRPQRLSVDMPLLMGPSVSGALRMRATWLSAVMGLAAPSENSAVIPPSAPVDRLFGVTGFRGLLGIEDLNVRKATSSAVTSVNLDRFSGAPIDNKLFTTEVFVGVRLSLGLALLRRGAIEPNGDDIALFERLCTDIETEGLQLGAGGNKGFGWFRIEGAHDGRE